MTILKWGYNIFSGEEILRPKRVFDYSTKLISCVSQRVSATISFANHLWIPLRAYL